MSAESFVHLHLHTDYSMLDGAVRIPDVMKKAVEFGMPAVAITDHGNLYGAVEFYQELHNHGIEAQEKCNRALINYSREFGLPLVAANDVHFLTRQEHEAHDVMICIGTGAMVHDEKRMHYVPELYFKSADEMRAL